MLAMGVLGSGAVPSQPLPKPLEPPTVAKIICHGHVHNDCGGWPICQIHGAQIIARDNAPLVGFRECVR